MARLADELPRPIARPGRFAQIDKDEMERWLNLKLGDVDRMSEEMRAANAQADEFVALMKADGFEVRAAEHGDIGPLRAKYPHLAKYLHPPKQPGRGKKFPKMMDTFGDPRLRYLTMAVWDAARIRIIWKRHYPIRPKGYDQPEEMAARRWNVDVERVYQWKKSRQCPHVPYRRDR